MIYLKCIIYEGGCQCFFCGRPDKFIPAAPAAPRERGLFLPRRRAPYSACPFAPKSPEKNRKNGKKNIDTVNILLYNVKELTQGFPYAYSEGGEIMSQVKVKENESLDSALRRFKRQTSRDGVIQEVRKREHYEKPSVKRKKKSEAARKRKYK